MWLNLINYFKEARHEMEKVNWPTRQQAVVLTGVVVGISLGVALFLGSLDLLFHSALRALLL